MKLKKSEVSGGKRWLALAGSVAVALNLCLLYVDDMLTYSTAEVEKANILKDLRTAASSLPAFSSVDARQNELMNTSRFPYPPEPEVVKSEEADLENASGEEAEENIE
jgi:hypothetical protein